MDLRFIFSRLMRSFVIVINILLINTSIADENNLRKKIIKKLGEVKIQSVKKTPYGNLYEVYMNDRLHYTDENFNFMVVGTLIDVNKNFNYSNQSLRRLTKIPLSLLPSKEFALYIQKGRQVENSNINRQELYLFSDPLCRQCQEFEAVLANFPQLDIYVYLLPNDAVNRGSSRMARAIWCAANPSLTYLNYMRKSIIPSEQIRPQCELPLQLINNSAQEIGFRGTPAMVFSDGFPFFGKVDEGRLRSLLRNNPAN